MESRLLLCMLHWGWSCSYTRRPMLIAIALKDKKYDHRWLISSCDNQFLRSRGAKELITNQQKLIYTTGSCFLPSLLLFTAYALYFSICFQYVRLNDSLTDCQYFRSLAICPIVCLVICMYVYMLSVVRLSLSVCLLDWLSVCLSTCRVIFLAVMKPLSCRLVYS